MAIRFTKYVNILSVVGGAGIAAVSLIGRLITQNPLLPTGTVAEFDTADEVGDYFGTASEEYARALFYFSRVSKAATQAQKISFASWAPAATPPSVFGIAGTYTLAQFTGVTDGALSISINGAPPVIVSGVNLSGAGSLGAVAADIATAINAAIPGAGVNVLWDATRGAFDFFYGTPGPGTVALSLAGTGTELLPLLGWGAGAIVSNGIAAQSITEMLTASTAANNNYGSFAFLYNCQVVSGGYFVPMGLAGKVEAATWNAAQNNQFQYHTTTTIATAATDSAALIGFAGTGMTIQGPAGEYHEMLPMAVLAAIDYTQPNAVQNYQYQQAALTPTVTSDTDSGTLDALRVNYYGQTQNAGQFISFYQQGFLGGDSTAATDMGVYGNEQWLKTTLGASLFSMLLALGAVSTNLGGQSQVRANVQAVANQALTNGVVSSGKTLTQNQQAFISSLTGNANAWRQVQSLGYWLAVAVTSATVGGVVQYSGAFTFVYAKNDSIRSVQGQDILI